MATGELGCAAISPAENNKVSPGRNGNSSPVSIKTMTMTPARTAPPNRPPSPSQYIGSMTSAGTRPMSQHQAGYRRATRSQSRRRSRERSRVRHGIAECQW
ncbi:Uncharacterised protein [Mycobacteroides abscessus subsp. abscessus]|nr:Uncharacterised protein [Mycobacteroides abscessus subsp. abscessus]